ncbi:MAG: class I SAM-dependent methyltransferase [Asgard group archaeon]|nr:class I SAM-dependent methyltransferase [Asgard group archaeon]
MSIILHQTPIYNFLWHIKQYAPTLEKKILDCGAGGGLPPLALFKEHGFETHGIDISKENIKRAEDFGKSHGMDLNIIHGDMRELPYDDQSFSFAFSYNTIFHMTKKDIKKALKEMRRVLKTDGLCYVNFMTIEDGMYGDGEELEKGECLQRECGEDVIHTFFDDDELPSFLEGFELIALDKRYVKRPLRWKDYTGCYFDCIIKKV